MPQDNFHIMRRLLPVATSNRLRSCFKLFQQNFAGASTVNIVKTSVLSFGSIVTTINNKNRKRTFCLNILDIGYYYIGPTVHEFEKFIYECQENVKDC